jgi:hypothetical protein
VDLCLGADVGCLHDDLGRREGSPEQGEHLGDSISVPAELNVVERAALIALVARIAVEVCEEDKVPRETVWSPTRCMEGRRDGVSRAASQTG